MKRRENFFCAKKTKQCLYSTIHLLWFSVAPFLRISAGRKQRTLFCVSRILEDGLSDDAFYTFTDLDSAIYYAVNRTVTSLPVLIQNILNCVPKMNKAFMGLERHGGK